MTIEEVLPYVAMTLGVKSEREMHWAAEAIQYANPDGFKFKDAKTVEEQILYDIWQCRVMKYFAMQKLMYSHTATPSEIHDAEKFFHVKLDSLRAKLRHARIEPIEDSINKVKRFYGIR